MSQFRSDSVLHASRMRAQPSSLGIQGARPTRPKTSLWRPTAPARLTSANRVAFPQAILDEVLVERSDGDDPLLDGGVGEAGATIEMPHSRNEAVQPSVQVTDPVRDYIRT